MTIFTVLRTGGSATGQIATRRLMSGGSGFFVQFDPAGERIDEALQEGLGLLGQGPRRTEEGAGVAQVSFRLLHAGYVEEHQGLTQMMVGTKPANTTGGCTGHRTGLAAPGTFA